MDMLGETCNHFILAGTVAISYINATHCFAFPTDDLHVHVLVLAIG